MDNNRVSHRNVITGRILQADSENGHIWKAQEHENISGYGLYILIDILNRGGT